MMGAGPWLAALLLCCLTGLKCGRGAVLLYSRIGGNLVLPCANLLLRDCSPITWTFFTSGGSWNPVQISKGADSHQRISITSNCSLSLRDLRQENAGSYTCCENGTTIIAYYLSLLTITSVSTITSLRPGGNLSLDCVLFTYFDAGNCRSYSMFNLSWLSEDGTTLPSDNRTRLIGNTRCSVTLVTILEIADNNRKWRCQVNTKDEAGAVFLDFTSAFVFESSSSGGSVARPAVRERPFPLPITRILLFAVLSLAAATAAVCTWRKDRGPVCTSAAHVHLQSVSTAQGL